MRASPANSARTTVRIGGWSLIVATVLFSAVFSYLAARFDYPDVLDRSAGEVLPRLVALGPEGRAVWVLYGLVPFLLVPAAIGVRRAAAGASPALSHAATISAVLAAAAMSIGLLRWPSLQWQLALAYSGASEAGRESIAALFAAANSYLGTFIGEFLGEAFLNAFFLFASQALGRSRGRPRTWLLWSGGAATALGVLAMLRNLTSLVAVPAAINNVALPIWMVALGMAMLTSREDL